MELHIQSFWYALVTFIHMDERESQKYSENLLCRNKIRSDYEDTQRAARLNVQIPLKSIQGCSGGAPGVILPKSMTEVTPLLNASLLALTSAALRSFLEGWGIQRVINDIAVSNNNPVGSSSMHPTGRRYKSQSAALRHWIIPTFEEQISQQRRAEAQAPSLTCSFIFRYIPS